LCGVRVKVDMKTPMGYPCPSLLTGVSGDVSVSGVIEVTEVGVDRTVGGMPAHMTVTLALT